MKYIPDTNVLLDDPESIKNYEVVITTIVLNELEKHKMSDNPDLAYRARRAIRFIKENESKFEFDIKDYNNITLGDDFDPTYADNRILQCCLSNKFGLITNDMSLRLKAKALSIPVLSIEFSPSNDLYNGYKEVKMTDEEMAYFYDNPEQNIYNLLINQYIIVKNNEGSTVDIRRWNGEKHVTLRHPPFKDLGIKPMNDLQRCAIDLLYNKQIPIKVIAGTYGSGKTLLSVKMGLWHVKQKGNYGKIMMVRNPVGGGEEIGFLPGDKIEKTYDFFKPIIQHLDGGEFECERMMNSGELLAEIPFYMKGLSLDGGYYVIVDEAEDLDLKTLKLIGTRIGYDSCIVFSGDYKQAENKYLRNNGLLAMIEKLKGHPLVGIIHLNEDVRSEASKVFAELE